MDYVTLVCEGGCKCSAIGSKTGTGRDFVPGYPRPYYPRAPGQQLP